MPLILKAIQHLYNLQLSYNNETKSDLKIKYKNKKIVKYEKKNDF